MSNIVKSSLHFFNDLVQGREAGNSAIRAFEADNNFISTSFIRELIQNAIDAWNKSSGRPVKLAFRLVDIEDQHQTFLSDLYKEVMPLLTMGINTKKSKPFIYSDKNLYKKALVIEEFNTIGLTGRYDRKRNNEAEWHFSNYMYGVNRDTKIEGGGSAGVGKITSNMVSELRSVMFITSRSDDHQVWAGGRVEFDKAHTIGNDTFDNCSFLSNSQLTKDLALLSDLDKDKLCSPIKANQDIDLLKKIFKLKRADSDNGTSWIIPAPLHETKDCKKTELMSVESYKKIILEEYSWAIIKGLIEIDLDGTLIDQEKVVPMLKETFPNKSDLWDFLLDVEGFPASEIIRLRPEWFEVGELNDAFLSDDDLEKALGTFGSDSKKTLCLKLPVTLKNQGKDEETYFHLFLQKTNNSSNSTNELVIRDYLPITGVAKSLLGVSGDAVNILILIEEEKLVRFCRSAEQPDHTDFIIRRASSRGYTYDSAQKSIRKIKGAAKKIFQFFNNVDIQDEDILSDLFSIITRSESQNKNPKRIKKKKPGGVTSITSVPRVSSSLIDYKKISNSEIRLLTGEKSIDTSELPLLVKVSIEEMVDLGTKNNILNYNDNGFLNISIIKNLNINILNQHRERLEFEISDLDFELHISGLDVSRTIQLSVEY